MIEKDKNFEIRKTYPTINPMIDDIERKILAPLSCLREFGSEYLLEFDLPMVEKKDISVSLDENNIISIEAKLNETYLDENQGYRHEFNYFKKDISLRGKVDTENIHAKFENGRLTIRIPKIPAKNKIKIE